MMGRQWKCANDQERANFAKFVTDQTERMVYSIAEEKRSIKSNALAWAWYGEIAKQKGDETAEEIHLHCKAYYGMPILLRDDPEFTERYTRLFKDRFTQTERMEVVDMLPVTRLMTKSQMKEYLETMQRKWAEQGIVLKTLCDIDYSDVA